MLIHPDTYYADIFMNKMLNISTLLTKLNVDYKLVGKYSNFNGFSSFFEQTGKSCTFIKEINPYTIEVLSKSVAAYL